MVRRFDPRKFLDLANVLIGDGRYEKDCRARTAMGRIYYSPFLLTLQKLREKGIPIKDSDRIHKMVIETCMGKRSLSTIGNGLNQLREKRVDADYHMKANITLDNCKKQARLAEYLIELIEQVKEIR